MAHAYHHAMPKLTYYNITGRGEAIRLAFRIGGQDFEDHRVEFKDWAAVKNTMPWGTIPVLEVDGKTIAQSNNILRFVGKRTGLYPTNYPAEEFFAAQIDEYLDVSEDLASKISATMRMPDDQKAVARKALAENDMPFHLERLEKRLHGNGGKHFVGSSLTVADLKLWVFFCWITSGTIDGFSKDMLEKHHALAAFHKHMTEHMGKYQKK